MVHAQGRKDYRGGRMTEYLEKAKERRKEDETA